MPFRDSLWRPWKPLTDELKREANFSEPCEGSRSGTSGSVRGISRTELSFFGVFFEKRPPRGGLPEKAAGLPFRLFLPFPGDVIGGPLCVARRLNQPFPVIAYL